MTTDPQKGIASAHDAFERAQQLGYAWGEGIAATFEAMLYAIVGESEVASKLFSHALVIQQKLADWEGAGMSLSGLASLAAARGDSAGALDLYRQSLFAFETCGDRGE